MLKAFVSTCMLAAVVCVASTPASASTFDKRTYFTFSQPVSLPGVTLPAGTYTFRLADPTTSRKVIQISDSAGLHSFALLQTMPAVRFNSRSLESEIQFMETGAGMPAAVKTWWYEGDTIGYEFMYSKAQRARLMAGLAPEPEAITAANVSLSDTSAVTAEPAATIAVDSDAVTVEERADAAITAEAAQQPPAAPVTPDAAAPADVTARDELPRTAGPVPLAALLGLVTMFGGLWLNRKS